ncbi:auxin efflux carrier family protein [Hyphomonas neptunium ATCC 15444]|uniref:Auxin efflux carrier family protein n=2 Tax=Hyphomonas TaxID=85 RepID=Q0BZU7_HYPNA|nr:MULTISPECIES: AEC family transporter [Hyphomonas]ABI75631.1 auxin efflux carrier family protein [Hyphomonas neptunium ATCC 15444]KCZ87879.1 auxin efflux carrier family protein [Hyphomonas hirschiana VP5]
MNAFLIALLPVILIVALGQLLSTRRWIAPEAFRSIDRLSFLVLLPALIVRALANAEFDTAPWQMVITLIAAQCLMGVVALAAYGWPGIERPAIGTIIQSNVRWNTIIALSLGAALFGDEGVALVGLAAAVMIPAANVLSVYALTAHAERPPGVKPRPFLAMTRNPLVIACIIGITLAALHIDIPVALDETLRILASAAIATGLLSAGAGVDLKALGRAGVRTFVWSLIRLIGMPAIVLAIGLMIGLTGLPLAIALLCAATSTAPNSYVLARELGGDTTLAANLIAVQTLLAAITLPLTWALILWLGAA